MFFENLDAMLRSEEYNNYIGDKLGNDLYLYDSDRKSRVEYYSLEGSNGSTHAESIEDMQDFVNNVYKFECNIEDEDQKDKHIESILSEIKECEQYHIDQGTINDIIG